MEGVFDYGDLNKPATLNTAELLIREVANTPVLWNRYHNDYNNRAAMDNEWERIAALLNKEKDFVKQKWRNLRDQFQREIKKVKVPFDNPTKPYIQYYRGKWIYFEQMLFLREGLAKRSNSCFSPSSEIEIHDEDIIKEELIVFEDSDDVFAEQANMYSNESDSYEVRRLDAATSTEESQTMTYGLLIQPKIEIVEDEETENKGFKRQASETNEPEVPTKVRKTSVADASSNTEDSCDIDDDLYFVKSLVPFLRKLSPIRKLLVRNEIQNLLIRESLCTNCKFGKSSSHHLE
ncbi:hypothetical protein PYW07_008163 [Mythimna separata]|uniref:MADF domain-containing protein n=1 Tax=Mythimna separata TaxID=271217 RepID=A0AAD7YRN5_MYTSE|nr:hypothetical protein PYW07_008163 [Mythimna separata]